MAGGLLFFLAAAFELWPYRFHYDSVCSQCGAIKDATEWQLPHIRDYSFFTRSTIKQTCLSSYLTSSGIVGAHSHQWLFGHGGGNDIKCALGDGDPIRGTVTSPEVVRLLELSRQFGGSEESSNLLKLVFDRDISRSIRSLASSVPANGFTTNTQYRAWIKDYRVIVDVALESFKKTN